MKKVFTTLTALVVMTVMTVGAMAQVIDGNVKKAPANPKLPVVATAKVDKLSGNQNRLYVTVEGITESDMIANNSAVLFQVGPYTVYVATKGNDKIDAIYVTEIAVEDGDGGVGAASFDEEVLNGWFEISADATCENAGYVGWHYYEDGELVWAGDFVYTDALGHQLGEPIFDGCDGWYAICERCGWLTNVDAPATLWDEFFEARNFVYETYFEWMDLCFYHTYWTIPGSNDCVEGLMWLHGNGYKELVTDEQLLYYIDILNNYSACDGCDMCTVVDPCADGHDYVAVSAVPSSTNLQNSTTVTIIVYGACAICGAETTLASASVRLRQSGTQTVKVGEYDVTVVVNQNNRITRITVL